MKKYKLVSKEKLNELSPLKSRVNTELLQKLQTNGTVSVTNTNIVGLEFMLWLARKNIVKEV